MHIEGIMVYGIKHSLPLTWMVDSCNAYISVTFGASGPGYQVQVDPVQ